MHRGGSPLIGHPGVPSEYPEPPEEAALGELLDRVAPLAPAPLTPRIGVFTARSLTEVWEAAEVLAGRDLPSPFWAWAWPGGAALARVLLDTPELVRGRTVLDVGCGGGVAALAAATAGAASVLAADIDPWAVAVTSLAARRQGLVVDGVTGDVTGPEHPANAEVREVVLCGDVAYERSGAPRIRSFLDACGSAGATVLVADPGRAYFDAAGLERIDAFELAVPEDVEGIGTRTATVYRLTSG